MQQAQSRVSELNRQLGNSTIKLETTYQIATSGEKAHTKYDRVTFKETHLKEAGEWLAELVGEVILRVDRQVVFKDIDRVLAALVSCSSLRGLGRGKKTSISASARRRGSTQRAPYLEAQVISTRCSQYLSVKHQSSLRDT